MINEQLTPEKSFRSILSSGIFWPLALVTAYCACLFFQASATTHSREKILSAEERIAAAEKLRTELLDMETGMRGYLLTADRAFLNPYEKEKPYIGDDLASLVSMSGDQLGEQNQALKIEMDARKWSEFSLALINDSTASARVNRARLDQAKDMFDTLRADFDVYITNQQQRVSLYNRDFAEGRTQLYWIAILGGALLIALLIFTTQSLLRRLAAIYHSALNANRAKAEEISGLNTDLEERVQQRTAALSNANRELEAFSYSVSHDLRAPLRSIASFSTILQKDLANKLDEDSSDNLERIRLAAKRMTELIDALLRFSKIARVDLTRSSVDVSALAQSIVEELKTERKVDIPTEIQPGMKVEADPQLTRVALGNMLENAWKFSSKNPDAKVEVGQDERGFFVRDNGVGFEQQFVDKIFLPFERLHTERQFPGTGIGLATAKRIIDRHGGKIEAESVLNKGTVFHFTLGASGQGKGSL